MVLYANLKEYCLVMSSSNKFDFLRFYLESVFLVLNDFCLNVEFSTHPLSCLLLQIKISGLFNGVSYDNRRQMTPLGLDIITSKLATKLKS